MSSFAKKTLKNDKKKENSANGTLMLIGLE